MSAYKRLTLSDRLCIYEQLKENKSVKAVANAVGVTISAIYYELKKGCENGEYNPYYADKTTKQLQKTKGAQNLIEGELAQIISHLILNEKLSPEKIIVRLQEMHLQIKLPLSVNTIYSAIDKGLIPSVTRKDLFAHKTTTHMFSDGLLHIPQWIRQELDIEDGTELSIEIKDNKIVIGKKKSKMNYMWEDYSSKYTEKIEAFIDSQAIKYAGCDDGFEDFYSYWKNELEADFWCKVVLIENEPIAVIAFAKSPDNEFTIQEFIVSPSNRGKGYGSVILKELLTHSKEIIGQDIFVAKAVIYPDNKASQRVFEKANFTHTATHPDGDALYYEYVINKEG